MQLIKTLSQALSLQPTIRNPTLENKLRSFLECGSAIFPFPIWDILDNYTFSLVFRSLLLVLSSLKRAVAVFDPSHMIFFVGSVAMEADVTSPSIT
jgi:hypothetical protein